MIVVTTPSVKRIVYVPVEKSGRGRDYRAMKRLVQSIQPIMRRDLANGLKAFQKTINLYEVEQLISLGQWDKISSRLIDWESIPEMFRSAIEKDFEHAILKGGNLEKKFFEMVVLQLIPSIEAEIPFSLQNPRILKWKESRLAYLSGKMEQTGFKAIDRVISASWKQGLAPRDASRLIRGSIGLNEPQAQALTNYRASLSKQGITGRKLDEMVGGYSDKMIKSRADTIAWTETNNAVNKGQMEVWEQANEAELINLDKTVKIWLALEDDITCDICRELNETEVPYKDQFYSSILGEYLDAPSAHVNCFDKETEVLTDNGWKYFYNLNGSEKYLSVDLKSGNAEWVRAVKHISYWYEGLMHEYKSRYCDLLVTPNHNQVVMFPDNGDKGRKINSIWQLIQDNKLPKGKFNFLATIPKWQGASPKKITIGMRTFDTEDFCEFMGYFLSEGSISQPPNNIWQIKISQNDGLKKDAMMACAKRMFGKIWIAKDAFYIPLEDKSFKDPFFIMFFREQGKSYEKHIPEIIKKLSKKYLRIFLDAYLKGDGSYRKSRTFKGYKFDPCSVYLTSSDRMAADIGELLLKCGKRPSYRKSKAEKEHQFRNGIYPINHPCWQIAECSNQRYLVGDKMFRKMVEYSGFVYDVELEKNHTLIVRRNGKVIVSGNCRCLMNIEFKD